MLVSRNEKPIQLRRPDYLRICWNDIVVVGKETILVKNIKYENVEVKNPKGILSIFSK